LPRLDFGARWVGDLDRAELGLDARLDDAAGFGRGRDLVIRRDMFGEVAVDVRRNSILAAFPLPLARGVVAIADRSLLAERPGSCLT
jgi:hypothetical protein